MRPGRLSHIRAACCSLECFVDRAGTNYPPPKVQPGSSTPYVAGPLRQPIEEQAASGGYDPPSLHLYLIPALTEVEAHVEGLDARKVVLAV